MWLIRVTRSQVWMESRCVKFGVIALTLSLWWLEVQHGTSWQITLWWSEKRIVALHKEGIGYKKIARTLKLSYSTVAKTYSCLTGQVSLRTGLAMADQRSWVHVLSVISRGCVWEIDVWVLPALLQRLGGQPVSAQTIHRTLHQIGLHGCRPRRKPVQKMMHKKARKQFAEDKQTKDMDYWKHVLWSDETDGSVMVWGCMSAAGTGELQLIEGTMNANMYCDILKQSMIPSLRRLGRRAVLQYDNDHCLAKETEGKGDGLAKHVSRPKPYWEYVGHPQMEGGGAQGLWHPPAPWCRHGGVEEDSSSNLRSSGELHAQEG